MTDINDVRPSSIRHIVGQQNVVAQVSTAIEAAFCDNVGFPSAALFGGAGLGKTTTAQIIAAEMATDYIEILGQSVKNLGDLNAVLLAATDKAVVFVDEAHELDRSMQTALYLALDQRKVALPGSRKGNMPSSIPLGDFTLLLATTDEYCLLQPLRDRMKLVLRFEFYSVDELTQIVRHRIKSLGWWVVDEVLPFIAQRSRGTPRLALRLLQAARRVCRAEGESTITKAHLDRACQLEQIDLLGLGPIEQKYLRILGEGPNRLNVLASMLGLPPRTVSQVTEQFLIRAGLVVKDDQGRRLLTTMAREHLATSRQQDA